MSLRNLGRKYRTGFMLGLLSVGLVAVIAACVTAKKKDVRKDPTPAPKSTSSTTTGKAVDGSFTPGALTQMSDEELETVIAEETATVQEGMANIGEKAEEAGDTNTADTMAQVAELSPEVVQAVAEVKDPDNVVQQADAEPSPVVGDSSADATGDSSGDVVTGDSSGDVVTGDGAADEPCGLELAGDCKTKTGQTSTDTTKTVVPDVGAGWGDYVGAGAATTVAALAVGLATYGAIVKLGIMTTPLEGKAALDKAISRLADSSEKTVAQRIATANKVNRFASNSYVVRGKRFLTTPGNARNILAAGVALGLSAAAIYTVYSIANSTDSSTNISLAVAGASLAASLGLGIYYAKNPTTFVKFEKLLTDIKGAAKLPTVSRPNWSAIKTGVQDSRLVKGLSSLVDRIRGRKPPAPSFKFTPATSGQSLSESGQLAEAVLSDTYFSSESTVRGSSVAVEREVVSTGQLGKEASPSLLKQETKLARAKSFFRDTVFTKKGGLVALTATVVAVGVYAAAEGLKLDDNTTEADRVATAWKNLQAAVQEASRRSRS